MNYHDIESQAKKSTRDEEEIILDEIILHADKLKAYGNTINNELTAQNTDIDDLNSDLDSAQDKITTVNRKMPQVIKNNGCNKCFLILVLLVIAIILAIILISTI
jgi:hypothetical protein